MSLLRYKQKLMPLGNPQGGGKGGGGSAPSPDPNIGIAQRQLADIQSAYLSQFQSEIWPLLKETTMKQEARADEQFALDKQIQATQIETSKKALAEYDRNAVNREAIYKGAEEYNTKGNFERQAGLAMGDVKDQFTQQRQQQNEQMRSFGINPSSGRYQGMNSAMGVMEAATAASAATKARNAAEQLGWAKSMDAAALGQGQFGNQATSTGLALSAGNQALNAGQTTMQNAGAMSGALQGATSTASQGWGQIGQLGVQKYNADVNAYSAQQQANAQSNAALGSTLGSLAGAGAYYFKGSDVRAKENIELVGYLPNGLAVYEYEYKPEFKDRKFFGHGRHRGVMAHEVEKVIPEAVMTLEDGYKVVDYSKVN